MSKTKTHEALYFPVFIDLSDKYILVVGAGPVASRRAGVLASFAGRVTVVAPAGTKAMEQLAGEGAVVWERRCFEPADLDGKYMVITATGDSPLNGRIADLCRARNIPVNHAGDRNRCDFYFPGIARQGNVVAGISTSGSNPGQASAITRQLKAWLAMAVTEHGQGEKVK